MNTNNLKRFAQEARKKLLEQVGAKLSYVLNADSALLREQAEQVQQLRQELNHTTKEHLIEKVAYTWFNRLMALRFMDANDYQPMGIRVITPKDGYTTPELLDEAKRGNISEDLKLNRQNVFDLLDGRIPSSNPQNEAFKKLLIAACNHLNVVFPFLFERISDYSELLLPDDLTSDFSIVTDIREGMLAEDCINVEIIGWLYQFYISEKKDEVFTSKSAIKKEDIPAATQLFTPRWIVEYMVQNTVGKLWLHNRPKSRLREYMPYFIESATMESDDYLRVSSPEEIRLLDPASGSGHILVYAFELFTKIYEEEGYNTGDIPKLIIEKNLHGFEIDERAGQLSGLALMMKAREYQRRALTKYITPNIHCFNDLQLSTKEIKEIFSTLQIKFSDNLMHDLINMQQATNFGSLILPQSNIGEMAKLNERLTQIKTSGDIFQGNTIEALQITINQLRKLSQKFHCVVANPPYMGSGNMNKELSEFVKDNYPDGKADLMVCFMDFAHRQLFSNGYLGMINLPSWMFLSSFEKYRKGLVQTCKIESLLHLGRGIFGSDFGSVTFVFRKTDLINGNGIYRKLFDKHVNVRSVEKIRNLFLNKSYGYFSANQSDFEKLPNTPIGYWLTPSVISIFINNSLIEEIADCKQGVATSDNDRFRRNWSEVSLSKSSLMNGGKWFPYNSGGDFKKWYGNQNYFINWENNGEEIRDFKKSVIRNPNYFFKECLSWSKVTAAGFALRYIPKGFIFDVAGCSIFTSDNEKLWEISALYNSKLKTILIETLAPTINYEVGQVSKSPFIVVDDEEILALAKINTEISKIYWDSREVSWDFSKNELLSKKEDGKDIEDIIDMYIQRWTTKFFKLHQNEEELTDYFIKHNNLHNDLSLNIDFKEITILQEELDKGRLEKLEKILMRDSKTCLVKNYHEISLPFHLQEIIAQFMSYAVGCMFGRYSLDKEGLILANLGETLQDYLNKIEKSANECSFLPDDDNIIPVLDDEWFEDDITGRFYEFLKVTFGEKNFNKNLAFVEEQLGKDVRKYITKDFYLDHIKRYKKRPIYWMFSSPKGSFNVLIYLHRYTPDTISNILNKYLREFVGKLKTRKEHLSHVLENGTPAQKTSAIKENDSIDKILIELQEYEREVLFPLATDRISIDLDDGVLVNYNKFGKAVKEVVGLNDAVTKKKVREFDWIDTSLIR